MVVELVKLSLVTDIFFVTDDSIGSIDSGTGVGFEAGTGIGLDTGTDDTDLGVKLGTNDKGTRVWFGTMAGAGLDTVNGRTGGTNIDDSCARDWFSTGAEL